MYKRQGIDILELSDQPEHLLQGQTSPTITKSKLYEVSLVDVGSNDDAIAVSYTHLDLSLSPTHFCNSLHAAQSSLSGTNASFSFPFAMSQSLQRLMVYGLSLIHI